MRVSSALGVHPLDILTPYFKGVIYNSAGVSYQANSAFIDDVTYPDYSSVMPNQTFTKTWLVINTCQYAWEGLFLTCQDSLLDINNLTAGLKPTEQRIEIPYTAPGEKQFISVELTAPSLPCTVKSEWKATCADGHLIFPDKAPLYCIVKVCSL